MALLLVFAGGFIAAFSFAGGSPLWAFIGIPLFFWGLSRNAKRRAATPTPEPPSRSAGAVAVGPALSHLSSASGDTFWAGDGEGFELGLAGESHYQEALRKLHESLPKYGVKQDRVYFEATLIPEPENPYDRNAVRVEAPNGEKVGYLPREQAASYASAFKRIHQDGRTVKCRAMACGGTGGKMIGVWISVDPPREVTKRAKANLAPSAGRSFSPPRRQAKDKPGHFKGRHFATYVPEMRSLKREERHAELEQLLLALVEATEAESASDRMAVAPAYYRELAILYRKLGRADDEIAILERYAAQGEKVDIADPALLERLARLKDRKSAGGSGPQSSR